MKFHDRLDKLEAALLVLPLLDDGNGRPVLIRVHGGIDTEPQHATAGPLRFRRAADETLHAFETRATAAAEQADEPYVVVGGLASL